jgi:hypothetical protein
MTQEKLLLAVGAAHAASGGIMSVATAQQHTVAGIFLVGDFARFGDFGVITLATEKFSDPFFARLCSQMEFRSTPIQGYPNLRQFCSQKNTCRYCVSPNCHCKKNSAAKTTLARGLLSSLATAWPAMTPGTRVKSC